jgi:hypothetical protein
MDAEHFDILARSLTHAGSRRSTLAASFGGLLTALGLTQPHIGEAKKKKPCPPCKTRKNGKCTGKLPNGRACAGGICQGGICQPRNTFGPDPADPPACLPAYAPVDATCGACCSGFCYPLSYGPGGVGPYVCSQGRNGGRCLTNGDCLSYECTNYRCVGPVQHAGDPCVYSNDCLGGICHGGPGATCTPAEPGEPCDLDSDCRLGTCGLLRYQSQRGRSCLWRDIFEPCASDQDCYYLTCDRGQCVCPQGYPDFCPAGQTGCIPASCNDRCGDVCNPDHDNPCGGCEPFLVCDFDPANPPAGYHCVPG